MLCAGLPACQQSEPPRDAAVVAAEPSHFVGSAACRQCHATEFAGWQESQHALAMQVADAATVLGNFANTTFQYAGDSTHFTTDDTGYHVATAGADGRTATYDVQYTFGVEPLQQYLVELPGGRLQALPYSWDTRPSGQGGQRWFHLYPGAGVKPGDDLHWTGRQQNWNYMCAECHSTNLKLGYDDTRDVFQTTWSEINVGCEACHGPASAHVKKAARGSFENGLGLQVNLDDRGNARWRMDEASGIAARSEVRVRPQQQPEACGRCHSRRGVVAPDYAYGKPLTDTHMPALLDEPLYFADGQMQGEVYVYGSFLQSRMYQAGVTCSDCHNPHTARLQSGDAVNEVCAQCHLPAKFATTQHHHHVAGDAGCVDCHMPARTYMMIDERRDHGFRIPRPDLAGTADVPNTCNACHSDRDASWAAAAMRDWYGASVFQRPQFASALAAGRAGHANAELRNIIASHEFPGIARATALTLLDVPLSDGDYRAIANGLADADPLLRIAAHRMLRQLPAEARLQFGANGLADPVLGVRTEAAQAFAGAEARLAAADAAAFRNAAGEYRAAYQRIAFRPSAQVRLGDFELAGGNLERAVAHYRRAIEMEPTDAIARTNLADLYRGTGQETEARQLLTEGLALDAGNPALLHSLGLVFARTGNTAESVSTLRQAAVLDPDNARYAYVLGVALNSAGSSDDAVAVLSGAHARFPTNFDTAWALATIYRDRGETQKALQVCGDLLRRYPDVQSVATLYQALQSTP